MVYPKTCGFRDPVTGDRDCGNPRRKEGATYCASHEVVYRENKRRAKYNMPPLGARVPAAALPTAALPTANAGMRVGPPSKPAVTFEVQPPEPPSPPPPPPKPALFTGERVRLSEVTVKPKSEVARLHKYIVDEELDALWQAALVGATKRPAGTFLWIGPAGVGKTDGGEALAEAAGIGFTKVDAASMTDPEAWFGTREIVVQDGVAVTDYRPSSFVESIQRPELTFIDEITRCRPEGINVLIPLIDHTRQVTNPLTGQVIKRHPQNFIVMAGNVGVTFVGTNAVDPAFWTRATKVVFKYLDAEAEKKVVMDASGCDIDTAYVLVRFANDSRAKAKSDDEFIAISTRELIRTGERVADGLDRDLAVKFEILNGVSDEGGDTSIRHQLNSIWTGLRAAKDPSNTVKERPAPESKLPDPVVDWVCPTHNTVKLIPSGTSQKSGKPYAAFKACGTFGCPNTEDNSGAGAGAVARLKAQPAPPVAKTSAVCGDCLAIQPPGRTTLCVACGATL